jgi:hypothetical protein
VTLSNVLIQSTPLNVITFGLITPTEKLIKLTK